MRLHQASAMRLHREASAMSENADGSADRRSEHVVLLVVGFAAIVFVALAPTRPFVLAGLWILTPVVVFGTLVQVFRGAVELRSAAMLTFAMAVSGVVVITIPLGYLVVSPTLADGLAATGFVGALVATGFARLSITVQDPDRSRDVPPLEAFPNSLQTETTGGHGTEKPIDSSRNARSPHESDGNRQRDVRNRGE